MKEEKSRKGAEQRAKGIPAPWRKMKIKSQNAEVIMHEINKGYKNEKAKEIFKCPPYEVVKDRKEKE